MRRRTLIIALLMAATTAGASNIDLVTLPARDSVQLTIYNSEDITLAKETRQVTVKKGANRLQFSWANTLIDPSSVEIRPLDHADEIEIVDTVFPGDRPQYLVWNIESEFEGQVQMEVTYFTSGLTWTMDYVAITGPDETTMAFDGYVRVFNNSGEEYDDAEVRLIVGTVNLVEKIAQLAQARGKGMPDTESREYDELRRSAMSEAVDRADMPMTAPEPTATARPREIVKEGLSEYFLFSIEGTQTVANGWSVRMLAVDAEDVPFDIVYRMRAHQYGPRPVRFFIWNNNEEHELGESPLPNGRVNVFRDNGEQGLSFLGQQTIRYVPVLADIEINLGPDDLVVYETHRMSVERLEFSYHHVNGHDYVDGWDERSRWVDTVRNYRTKPIIFELHRQWPGDVEYDSEVETTLFDYQTTATLFEIGPRDTVDYPATVTISHQENAEQLRIRLE